MDKTIANNWCASPMMIHKVTAFVEFRLQLEVYTQINQPTKKIKVPKVVKPINKKLGY